MSGVTPVPDIDDFIASLLRDRHFSDNIVATQELEPVEALWTGFPPQTRPELLALLKSQNFSALYEHQRAAIDAALNGENVVLSTGVASGKSLCYQLPILQTLLISPQSRSLLLFPTKALAQDQQQKMQNLLMELKRQNPKTPNLKSGIYDGDTASEARRGIRNQASLIFSNPDMLHLGILPNHTLWSAFFANLKWVVIDEVHIYRGVFGSHFANVLRRLKRVCALYGSRPQFICTSATVANARELAQELLESPVTLVEKDSSPHGRRIFMILNPPIVDSALGIRRSALIESTALAKRWLHTSGQAILFCGPRRSVEILYLYLLSNDFYKNRVRSYRSGYLAENRRQIEKELREGSIGMVVSTNALELGIDIGGLDAVFLNSYPGTISATRQQAGRAGRKGNTALAILVASANPLDQYICQHPGYLFDNNPEHALISPDHHEILQSQLLCAIHDLALLDSEGFGSLGSEHIFPYLEVLVREGKARKIGNRYVGVLDAYPAAEVSLRNISEQVQILSAGEQIGWVDAASALWMMHPNAIYLDKGDTWIVRNLDLKEGKAEIEPISVNYFTQPTRDTEIECTALMNRQPCQGAEKYLGRVKVTTTITGFKKLKFYTQEVIGREALELPPTQLDTVAWWIGISPETVAKVKAQGLWNTGTNDYGKDWAKITRQIRERDRFLCQHCGVVETETNHHVHHIIPFKKFATADEANAPENLVTLCARCHRLAEQNVQMQNGISALGYLLVNLSPFFVMCDRKDIDVFAEDDSPLAGGDPVVLIYDNISGGIGLSRKLFDLHDRVLAAALDLAEKCPCSDGCPSCVGPVAENGVGAKAHAIAILEQLVERDGK
ncbi:MAG TPA: DEAD/DEAH box helicase [Candidatus Syntrophosphaera sp.]|nr:DEAD/DEAH box helicase [Candidatus Syntrophosphaera sp.]